MSQTAETPSLAPSAPRLQADLERLLQRVPAVLYVADTGAEGRWHYASPQIERVLGFTPEEWCADPGLWMRCMHPDDVERVVAVEVDPDDGWLEYRLRHRDGHVVWVRDAASIITGEDGVQRWHGVMTDVTEHKTAAAEVQRRTAQQAAVARLGEQALRGAGPVDLMRDALDATVTHLDVEIAAVLELLCDDNTLAVRAITGLPDDTKTEIVSGGVNSQGGYTLLNAEPAIVSDWEVEGRFGCAPVLRDAGVRSGFTVLIEGRRGPWGILGVHSRQPQVFTPQDVDFVQALANVLGDVVERQLTEEEIRHRALHDALTGLPNRTLFSDRLGQTIERVRRHPGSMSAVLALDLDRFKLINESLGHEAGDELLSAAASRLRQVLRSTDTVARFGADEFGILLNDISGEQQATEMAERIAATFNRPFVLAGAEHFVTTTIGIALSRSGARAEDLIRDAEAAMHRAKERGPARYELFDERLRGRAISRLRVENDLRRALDRDELRLHYQPQVSLRDRRLVGVEALIRWEHPERGMVSPAEFIPVAEDSGLIEPIGRWVLESACRQAAAWHRRHPDRAPVGMSVNISAVQLSGCCLPGTVAAAVDGAGLDPGSLTLELTESVLLGDLEELAGTLEALKGTGVRLVLDDFGTGYSSMSYLTRLPLDALKVDRSFIDGLGSDPRDTAVTEAIIAMSHALSLEVVGEGTETLLQISELERLACDVAQGFHFSRPVPAAELTRMLDEGPPWPSRDAPLVHLPHAQG